MYLKFHNLHCISCACTLLLLSMVFVQLNLLLNYELRFQDSKSIGWCRKNTRLVLLSTFVPHQGFGRWKHLICLQVQAQMQGLEKSLTEELDKELPPMERIWYLLHPFLLSKGGSTLAD